MTNRAAWLKAEKAHPFVIDDDDETPTLEPHQLLVKTRAVAINPVDSAVQRMGIIVREYPAILGIDMAGDVAAVGSAVTRFRVGDRVSAAAASTEAAATLRGSFRLLAVADDAFSAHIPDRIAYADACVLPLAMGTAGYALFQPDALALPLPALHPIPTGTTLLVWGAASSVGSCAVQLARAAGCAVFATASPKNFDYCTALGADKVFDYNSPTVVDDIVDALRGARFAGAFDAAMPPDTIEACNQIARRVDAGNRHVATVLPHGFPLPDALPEGVATSYSKPPDSLLIYAA